MKKDNVRECMFEIEEFLHGSRDIFTHIEAQGVYNIIEDFKEKIIATVEIERKKVIEKAVKYTNKTFGRAIKKLN